MNQKVLHSGIHKSQVDKQVLLCRLSNGLGEAVEPGEGSD